MLEAPVASKRALLRELARIADSGADDVPRLLKRPDPNIAPLNWAADVLDKRALRKYPDELPDAPDAEAWQALEDALQTAGTHLSDQGMESAARSQILLAEGAGFARRDRRARGTARSRRSLRATAGRHRGRPRQPQHRARALAGARRGGDRRRCDSRARGRPEPGTRRDLCAAQIPRSRRCRRSRPAAYRRRAYRGRRSRQPRHAGRDRQHRVRRGRPRPRCAHLRRGRGRGSFQRRDSGAARRRVPQDEGARPEARHGQRRRQRIAQSRHGSDRAGGSDQ